MDVTKKLDFIEVLIPEWEKLMGRKSQSMYDFHDSLLTESELYVTANFN